MRKDIRALSLTVLFTAVGVLPSASQSTLETIPIEEIVPGMVGEGRTVFSGDNIESFKVTIMGVLRNSGPKSSMILAELEGGPLAHTGVIAGMSGSPVYIDGKLIGAVAFAFPFAKDPIAGITPIDEMLAATDTSPPRREASRLEFPLTPEKLSAAAPHRLRPVSLQGVALSGVDRLEPYLGRNLTPIAMPAAVVGFPAESFDVIAPLLRQLGIEPLMGGAPVGGQAGPQASLEEDPLEPGDSVGVGLVTGDLQIAASGTVTHVDPDTGAVYAFGHPLFNLGPINYPMTRSNVHLVLPSVMNSFKMASAGDTIGTWVQDRATAIKGTLGMRPRMIPFEVTLTTSRGQEKTYELEIVNDELFTPILSFSSLIAILQTSEREFGGQTVELSAWLETADNGNVNIEDVFTDQQAAIAASSMVAGPLSFLMNNDFEDVEIEGVRVEVKASETPKSARVVRAWLDNNEVAPGETVELKILLKSYRGDEVLETVDIVIPTNVPVGSLRLTVADASTVSAIERREARNGFVPKDMAQLVRAINALRKNSRLYVRLSRPDSSGAIVAGEYLSSLPPSVMGVLAADESSTSFTALRSSTFLEQEIATDFDVSGARVLNLEVKKR